MWSSVAVSTALSLVATVHAQSLAKTCPVSDICFQLNIPEATASSGTGDIFFQLRAPTSYQWVSLGQGSQMSGSNIFVMYTSTNGKNVTLSPRLGTGHVEPQHDTQAEITLLAGTGVSNGMMTANVKCSNCNSWSGGTMDFSKGSSSWIYAHKSGNALNTDDLSTDISQHDDASAFSWNIASAKGGDSQNPFMASSSPATASGAAATSGSATVSGSASTSLPPCSGTAAATATLASLTATGSGYSKAAGTACPTAYPAEFTSVWPTARPTWASSCFPSGYSSWPTSAPWQHGSNNKREESQACINEDGSIISSQSGNGGSDSDSGNGSATYQNAEAPFGGDYQKANSIILAHGVLAALAFIALFPIGGILIRIANFTGLIWVHAACQLLAYLIYIVAFGLGIYYAIQMNLLSNHHPIIGIVLLVVLFLQPFSGLLHHRLFKKYGTRTAWSYGHLLIGRIAIILGIINGGLGIRLAGDVSMGGKIAYAVVAAIMGLAYIAAVVVGERRRGKGAPPRYDGETKEAFPLGSSHGVPKQYTEGGEVREHYGINR
ncbi:hypothetical protein DOTSEDRAFT_68941 [Dothistroma septosporum NZE10]|uniref:Cytochrome b561 domain-containing protein n=1 Tax=Dothistroma septosporum (strain NZE10 / CBS 128990) TaxID=675120 RepID=N1Q371_DOTSN|nr:hypothetical protein DOTSEDRAFT_68941 [Dothistroma septosporum NZE10]